MSLHTLLDHFYKDTGIEFNENRTTVDRKLVQFYTDKGFNDYNDFFSSIKTDKTLYQELINLLTTSETYFYREFYQIEICISHIKDLNKKIKILSAPCASGEEPYSLIIAMLENKIDLNNIEIYAIDINTEQINIAKDGIYSQRRLHKLSKEIKEKYFIEHTNDKFEIKPEIKKHVHFKQMNIFENFSHDLNNFDVIFSRNMLIYFNHEAQAKAEKIFYDKLCSGGYLFLGHADKIPNACNLKKRSEQGTVYYQK